MSYFIFFYIFLNNVFIFHVIEPIIVLLAPVPAALRNATPRKIYQKTKRETQQSQLSE
jgi:hypothetical protein